MAALCLSICWTVQTYRKTRYELVSAQLQPDDSWLLFTNRRESLSAQFGASAIRELASNDPYLT